MTFVHFTQTVLNLPVVLQVLLDKGSHLSWLTESQGFSKYSLQTCLISVNYRYLVLVPRQEANHKISGFLQVFQIDYDFSRFLRSSGNPVYYVDEIMIIILFRIP